MGEGIQGPSRTAVLTAVARALQREQPQPWVMDDRLALALAGPDGLALLDQLRAEVPRDHLLAFSRWMCVRARFAEDIVDLRSCCALRAAGGVDGYVDGGLVWISDPLAFAADRDHGVSVVRCHGWMLGPMRRSLGGQIGERGAGLHEGEEVSGCNRLRQRRISGSDF